jgi:hypothetical protein
MPSQDVVKEAAMSGDARIGAPGHVIFQVGGRV